MGSYCKMGLSNLWQPNLRYLDTSQLQDLKESMPGRICFLCQWNS